MLSLYLTMVDTENEKDLIIKLYNAYKNPLFNLCVAILHNVPDAEDAVHETFLRIIKNLSKITDIDSPQTKSFCIVIARNVAADMIRKNKKTVAKTDEELDVYASELSNEDTAISNIGVEILTGALKKLPKKEYDVLLLTVRYKMSVNEISELLGIGCPAVRFRLKKARERILNELEGKNNE